jgi:hypothetical protein
MAATLVDKDRPSVYQNCVTASAGTATLMTGEGECGHAVFWTALESDAIV